MKIQRSTGVLPSLVLLALGGPTQTGAQAASAEIEELVTLPTVELALQLVDERDIRTMSDLLELTEIPAPPFGEDARGLRFAEMLAEYGADSVWTDREGNVLGLRRGAGPSPDVLAVTGHLDTVFPEGTDVTVRQRGDTLFAPGIADDARGLAVVLAILRTIEEAGIETRADLLFVGTVGEEGIGDLRGAKHLFGDRGPWIDAFISIDGAGHGSITHQGLGSRRYRVTVRGPGGHSWGAFGLANPAHALARAISTFEQAADAVTRAGPRTSYNVGRVGGGTSVNSIPFESWMEIDMRSVSPEHLAMLDEVFQHTVRRTLAEANATRREGPELTVEVEMIGDRPSGEIPPDHPFIESAIAVSRHLGIEPVLGRGSTDSNIPISLGVPAMTIGGGGVSFGTHSPGEWFMNRDGTVGVKRALLIALARAGVVEG